MPIMDNIKKILKISYELGLSHIGSNISVLPILEKIYKEKSPDDIVILDGAHAHLAHLIVRTPSLTEENIKNSIEKFGIHCDKNAGCDITGGSLGHGIGIGIGLAISNPTKKIHIIVTDGSMMEGSNWEALRLIDYLNIKNISIHCNFNNYTAIAELDWWRTHNLKDRIKLIIGDRVNFYFTKNGEGFEGVQGHYKVLDEKGYNEAIKTIEDNERLAHDLDI